MEMSYLPEQKLIISMQTCLMLHSVLILYLKHVLSYTTIHFYLYIVTITIFETNLIPSPHVMSYIET